MADKTVFESPIKAEALTQEVVSRSSLLGTKLQENIEDSADDDCRIRNIEGRPLIARQADIYEINNMAAKQPVNRIANYSTADQPEAYLVDRLDQCKVLAEHRNQDEDHDRKCHKQPGEAFQHAPCCPMINSVSEVEKSRDKDLAAKWGIQPESES